MYPTDLRSGSAEYELPAHPESVSRARHAARDYAAQCGADSGDVALAVSEAVSNAVLHAYRRTTPGAVEICARITRDERLLVVVADQGDGFASDPSHKGLGLGLSLIGSVAESVELKSGRDGVELRMQFACESGSLN
jgi:serine/threonine-protein kinase RsbW/stage II sporulation protein AB (anti-sigma F factor)